MHAFAGQLTAIVQSSKQAGTITLQASAKGLKPASIRVEVK
jgi:beta-galactosidase